MFSLALRTDVLLLGTAGHLDLGVQSARKCDGKEIGSVNKPVSHSGPTGISGR